MEGHIPNGILLFDGNNYAHWRNRIQNYLIDLGVYIWISVVNGYEFLEDSPTDPNEKKLMSCN